MKTLLIAVLLGTSLLSAQAHSRTISNSKWNNIKTKTNPNEAEELKQKVGVQLYNLEMLRSQYKNALEAIKNSKGNHKEIDKDFEYFHNLLQEDAKAGKNKEDVEKSIQQLKKDYARKHKHRAAQELKEQKALTATMQKELSSYNRECKALKSKYKKLVEDQGSTDLQQLEKELEETQRLIEESNDSNVKTAAYYDQIFQDTKNA